MIVNFYGTYRLITERKSVEFEIKPEGTLYDLLQMINIRYPQLGEQILDDKGNLYPYIPIYITGRNPRLLTDGIHTRLNSTDIVSLFSPVSSGHINVEEVNRLSRGTRKAGSE